MGVKLDQMAHEAEDAEVTNCVSNLIQAFSNGLTIFKRLRERRRKRRQRKEARIPEPTPAPELHLSESLRRGPQDLAEKYAECYAGQGPLFAKGDAIAHASLAETLIKLNTGLVSIISAFLNHQRGKNHLELDYASLTDLSDISRKEALQSMTQLYKRVSQSQLRLYNLDMSTCHRCEDSHHVSSPERSNSQKNDKKKHRSSRQRISGPVVTRMPIKSSSQSQLVVMRPKNKRKSSSSSGTSSSNNSSSNSSSSSNSTSNASTPTQSVKHGSSTAYTSPLASPLPKYVPIDPIELYVSSKMNAAPGAWPEKERQRVDSFDDPRPTAWPHIYTPTTPEYDHHPIPELPVFTPIPRKHVSSSPKQSKPLPPPPPHPTSSPIKRRMDKPTPSSYTFASDSTKLGEIPQHHWTNPWDFEEAERLNGEAAVAEYPITMATAERHGKKKGLFGFLRRGSSAGVAP